MSLNEKRTMLSPHTCLLHEFVVCSFLLICKLFCCLLVVCWMFFFGKLPIHFLICTRTLVKALRLKFTKEVLRNVLNLFISRPGTIKKIDTEKIRGRERKIA